MHSNILKHHQSQEPKLYIGKVSELTGASCKAIRHYEALGLIPPPRRKGNYRVYSEYDIYVIHMIKRAQSVGFSLSELRELVASKIEDKHFPLQVANKLVDRKRAALRGEINALEDLDQRLVALQAEMNRTFG